MGNLSWTLIITESFERYLRRIEKRVATRIIRKINILKEDPFKGKLLRGLIIRIEDNVFRVYSLRVGDYRVIYTVNPLEKKVYLLLVGHRDWIYKEADRLLRG